MDRYEIQEILKCPVCGDKTRIDRVERDSNEEIDRMISCLNICTVREERTIREGSIYYKCSECESTLKVPLTYKIVLRRRIM